MNNIMIDKTVKKGMKPNTRQRSYSQVRFTIVFYGSYFYTDFYQKHLTKT